MLHSVIYIVQVRSYNDVIMMSSSTGDQVSRRGTLMGGYYDLKSSRMDTQRLVKMHRESVEKAKGEKAGLQQEIEDILLSIVMYIYIYMCSCTLGVKF